MSSQKKMQIFRGKDAPALMESGVMSVVPFTPQQNAGAERMTAAGFNEGEDVKVLVCIPGFSLASVWFGKDFPLPLHSHDADCLYYIVSGSLQLGTESLGVGDSFFVPADAPYTYTPGPEGVHVLEFRHATSIDFRNHVRGEAFYDRAETAIAANREAWTREKRARAMR